MNEVETTGFTELAVAVGRIEEKVSRVAGIEDRLREVEKSVERIETKQRPTTPWYLIVGGVVGILSGAGTLIGLIVLISKFGG